jgi:hypothetical protein
MRAMATACWAHRSSALPSCRSYTGFNQLALTSGILISFLLDY